MANDNTAFPSEESTQEIEEMLYAQRAEIESFEDLTKQRGTNIPALFNQIYKFVSNPSSVSVETFKRMVDTDDTIGSGIDFLCTCLAARLGPYNHPNKEIATWTNKVLESLEGGWFTISKEILSATWAGFSVSEVVWKNDEHLGFIPAKIVTLPPTTIMFETERTGELTSDGILQYQRNWINAGMPYFSGFGGSSLVYGFANTTFDRPDAFARLGDLPFPLRTANSWQYLSIRIPKSKCIHYAFDAQGKFGNPYGRSLLRRAYKYYVMKDSTLQMMMTALDRKGTPLTIVYADPNTTLQDASKVDASAGNQRNQRIGTRADKAASDAFANIHNDSTIVLPGKKGSIFETDFVPQDSNTESFIQALDFCNKSKMRALLIPSLIFTNGDGTGSYALRQEHAKTFLKILDGNLEGYQNTIVDQLIKPLLKYNWPEADWAAEGPGSFGRRDFSDENLERLSTIWSNAIDRGIIDTTDLQDLNRMRDALGFPEREKPVDDISTQLSVDDEIGSTFEVDQSTSREDEGFNGAQVTAILEVLERVSAGAITAEGGVNLLIVAFQMTLERAQRIVNGAVKMPAEDLKRITEQDGLDAITNEESTDDTKGL